MAFSIKTYLGFIQWVGGDTIRCSAFSIKNDFIVEVRQELWGGGGRQMPFLFNAIIACKFPTPKARLGLADNI